MLLDRPHMAKQVASNMKGIRILRGTIGCLVSSVMFMYIGLKRECSFYGVSRIH